MMFNQLYIFHSSYYNMVWTYKGIQKAITRLETKISIAKQSWFLDRHDTQYMAWVMMLQHLYAIRDSLQPE